MACRLADHTDFDQIMAEDDQGNEIILVKVDGQMHAYSNHCPHIGAGLDYGTGQCLTPSGHLQCSLHGALFEPDTGYCFAGPCNGQSLQRVPITIRDNQVLLDAQ